MLKTAGTLKLLQPPYWLLKLRSYRWFYPAVFAVTVILLTWIWITPFPVKLFALEKELIRGSASLAVIGIGYLATYWYAVDRLIGYRTWVLVGSAVCFLTLIIALHYVDRFPQLNRIDELHNWHV